MDIYRYFDGNIIFYKKFKEMENQDNDDIISYKVITNDGSSSSAEGLISLKCIIARQLPKMPKEYIVRLVFDRRHFSLVICRQSRIIGGICYRPYFEQRFAEIAFCAINGTEQVKGYGTLLMNRLKHHVQKQKLEYFLTYADNYALGYFQKQGFSKNIAMPKDRWYGFIKDYDGGTLMECYIHPGMDYLNVNGIIAKQRAFVDSCIQDCSKSSTVHKGIELFRQGKRLSTPSDIPGINEAGWNTNRYYKNSTERDRTSAMSRYSSQLKSSLDKFRQSQISRLSPFFDIIVSRVKDGDFYRNKDMIIADLTTLLADLRHRDPHDDVCGALEKVLIEFQSKDVNNATNSSSNNNNIINTISSNNE